MDIQLNITVTSAIDGLDEESFGPISITDAAITGILHRRSVILSTSAWTTLDAMGITPYVWILVNLDDTDHINIGFGSGGPILLPANKPALWYGDQLPRAQAATGTPRLMYGVIAQT